ncbi:MAG: hypothetical protein ACFE9Q_11310 [Candidatus Hodarchaeota archaeon]
MVYIITEHWWPPGKSEGVGKVYLEVMKKFPDDRSIVKPIIQSAVWPVPEAMHSITVSTVQPGKVKEAMDLSTNRLLMLGKAIEGFRYTMNIAYDLVEAMPFVGLKAPES